MIKLVKQNKPNILEQNAATWTALLAKKISENSPITDAEKSRYRNPEIKAALIAETHGKCAYCESKLLHITYGDVEHIHPKSKKIELSFQWDNLTLACDVCNTKKGDREGIIDPYTTDPNEHFFVTGPLVLARSARFANPGQ